MQLRKCIPTALWLTFAAAFAFAAAAPAEAKEGTFSETFAGFGTTKIIKIGKDRRLLQIDFDDLSVSDNPMFDHLTYRCWGLGDFTKGVGRSHGYCIATDPAGDQLAIRWESEKYGLAEKSYRGSEMLIGGTGKFAGITGTGKFVDDGNMFRPTEKGTYFDHGTVEFKYKLP